MAAPAPKPTTSARLARRDYLNRLRAESSYSAARKLAGVVFGLISIIGGLAVVAAIIAMLKDVAAGAVLAAAGLATIGLAIAAWQACVVIFDIADVLIDGRK